MESSDQLGRNAQALQAHRCSMTLTGASSPLSPHCECRPGGRAGCTGQSLTCWRRWLPSSRTGCGDCSVWRGTGGWRHRAWLPARTRQPPLGERRTRLLVSRAPRALLCPQPLLRLTPPWGQPRTEPPEAGPLAHDACCMSLYTSAIPKTEQAVPETILCKPTASISACSCCIPSVCPSEPKPFPSGTGYL